MTETQMRGGSYYRTAKGRIGRWEGVSYNGNTHVELVDLQGAPFKAALSTLTAVHSHTTEAV